MQFLKINAHYSVYAYILQHMHLKNQCETTVILAVTSGSRIHG
nr:MAG TPA: hypothetical protein [Caudoviricetes sp.]